MDEQTKSMNKALFLNMVMMFSTSAMQQLGKIVNPSTGKTGVDLQGAQFFIDLLSMLKAKTEGNLDKEESRLITDTLATLQLNYVETASEAGKSDSEGKTSIEEGAAKDASAEKESAPGQAAPDGSKPDEKDPRFHKSYG